MKLEFLSPSFRRHSSSISKTFALLACGVLNGMNGMLVGTFLKYPLFAPTSTAYSLGAYLGWGFAIGCLAGLVVCLVAYSVIEKDSKFEAGQKAEALPVNSEKLEKLLKPVDALREQASHNEGQANSLQTQVVT